MASFGLSTRDDVVARFAAPSSRPHQPAASRPCFDSRDLFRDGATEVLIEHRGECYRLRLTRQDKLILNK